MQIARELQSLKHARDFHDPDNNSATTTLDLVQRHKPGVSTLDIVFRKRFLAMQKNSNGQQPLPQPTGEVTVDMNMNGPTPVRKPALLNRTLDLRAAGGGVNARQPERHQTVEVFHLGRNNDHLEGSERGSMKSTTSF